MSDGLELRWPGKYDEHGERRPVPRPGASLRERTRYRGDAPHDGAAPNRLIEGDNLLALDALAREEPGSVDLAYIDPPFATGGRFEVVTAVGEGPKGVAQLRQPAYSDRWSGGTAGLLAMLDPRLRLIHELLAPHGSLYVHVDPTVGHAVKLLLDEVFGPGCFQREIIWRIGWVSGFKTKARNWIRNHDVIFFYVKDSSRFTFNKSYMPHPPGYRRRDGALPTGKGVPIDDVWNAGDTELALRGRDSLDSIQIKSFSTEKTGYATQKNESLLRRIVEASSNPGDVVLDAFCGSGTTMAVAEELGRRWIGCDTGRAAIQIATTRLLGMPRARDFGVMTVIDDERRAWEAAALRRASSWRAQVRRRVAAVLPTVAEDLRVQAEASGDAAGHVAAWHWAVDVPVVTSSDGVLVGEAQPDETATTPRQLVLQREVFDRRLDARPQDGFVDRALIQIRLLGLATGAVQVELQGLAYPRTHELPKGLEDASLGAVDLVERWSVACGEDDGAPVDVVLGRFERGRSLTTTTPAITLASGTTACLLVAVHDVFHREHRLRCELERGAQGWWVVRAQALAES